MLDVPPEQVGALSLTESGTTIQSRLIALFVEVIALELSVKLFATITKSLASARSIPLKSVDEPQARVSTIVGTEEFCAVCSAVARLLPAHEDKGCVANGVPAGVSHSLALKPKSIQIGTVGIAGVTIPLFRVVIVPFIDAADPEKVPAVTNEPPTDDFA